MSKRKSRLGCTVHNRMAQAMFRFVKATRQDTLSVGDEKGASASVSAATAAQSTSSYWRDGWPLHVIDHGWDDQFWAAADDAWLEFDVEPRRLSSIRAVIKEFGEYIESEQVAGKSRGYDRAKRRRRQQHRLLHEAGFRLAA